MPQRVFYTLKPANRHPRFDIERAIKANRARIAGPRRVLDAEIGANSGREVVSPDGVVCYVNRRWGEDPGATAGRLTILQPFFIRRAR